VWVALAGQVAFIASWVVAGALEPRYSGVDQAVSELGAKTAAHPWIVNAGIVLLGLSFTALGIALLRALPRRRAAKVAVALFVAAGALVVLSGAFRLDCEVGVEPCHRLWRAGALSWQTDAHAWTAFVAQLLLTATPFAIAWALWPAPSGAAALGSGVFGLLFGALSWGADAAGTGYGVNQRAGLAVLHLWVLIVGVGILYATRRRPPLSELIPLRPRDFLARSWAGEGEFMIWPYFLGRRLARRFIARREATWVSDRVWRFDDVAQFADGRVQRRRTFCEFVSDDHVRLTAGDLPDGVDVWIEEGGYRMAQFRMAFPIGPFPVYIRVQDHSYLEPDGTFANVFEARSLVLGLPMSRVVFRVRPRDRLETDAGATPREVTA
jgi:hypothetical protein